MLRAISDVNLAKFLAFDLPLFKGITKDLFPGVDLPEIDYSSMYECINEAIEEDNLLSVPYFIEKIIQLYEMILVRHGLMVVGLPFSGMIEYSYFLENIIIYFKREDICN